MKRVIEHQQTSGKSTEVSAEGLEMLQRGRRRPWSSSRKNNNNEKGNDESNVVSGKFREALSSNIKPAEAWTLNRPANPVVAYMGMNLSETTDREEELLEGDWSGSEGSGCIESLNEEEETYPTSDVPVTSRSLRGTERVAVNRGAVSVHRGGAINASRVDSRFEVGKSSVPDNKRTVLMSSSRIDNKQASTAALNYGGDTGETSKPTRKTAIKRALANIRRKRVGQIESSTNTGCSTTEDLMSSNINTNTGCSTPDNPASSSVNDFSNFKICVTKDGKSGVRKVVNELSDSDSRGLNSVFSVANDHPKSLEDVEEEENEFERLFAMSFQKAVAPKEDSSILDTKVSPEESTEPSQETSVREVVPRILTSPSTTPLLDVSLRIQKAVVCDIVPWSKKPITEKKDEGAEVQTNNKLSDSRHMTSEVTSRPASSTGSGVCKGVRRKNVVVKRKQESSSDEHTDTTDDSGSDTKKGKYSEPTRRDNSSSSDTKRGIYNHPNNTHSSSSSDTKGDEYNEPTRTDNSSCSSGSVAETKSATVECNMDGGLADEALELFNDAAQPDAFVFDMIDNDDYLISDSTLEADFNLIEKKNSRADTAPVKKSHQSAALHKQGSSDEGANRLCGSARNDKKSAAEWNDIDVVSSSRTEVLDLVNSWIGLPERGNNSDVEDSVNLVVENYFKSDRVITVHHLMHILHEKLRAAGITDVSESNQQLSTSVDDTITSNVRCLCDIGLILLHKLLDHCEQDTVGSFELLCSACITSHYIDGLTRIRAMVCEGVVQWYNKRLLHQSICLLAREACASPCGWEEFGETAVDLSLCGLHSGIYLPLPSSSCKTLIIYSWLTREEMRLVLCAYMKTIAETSAKTTNSSREVTDTSNSEADKDIGKWVVRIVKQMPSMVDVSVKNLVTANSRKTDVAIALSILETVISEDLEPASFEFTHLGLNTVEIQSCRMSQILSILPANVRLDCQTDWSKTVTSVPPIKCEKEFIHDVTSTSSIKSSEGVSQRTDTEECSVVRTSALQGATKLSRTSNIDSTKQSRVEPLSKISSVLKKIQIPVSISKRISPNPVTISEGHNAVMKKPLSSSSVDKNINTSARSLQKRIGVGGQDQRDTQAKRISTAALTSSVHTLTATTTAASIYQAKLSPPIVRPRAAPIVRSWMDSTIYKQRFPELRIPSGVRNGIPGINLRPTRMTYPVMPNHGAIVGRRTTLPVRHSNFDNIGISSSVHDSRTSADQSRNFAFLTTNDQNDSTRKPTFPLSQQGLGSRLYSNRDNNVATVVQPSDDSLMYPTFSTANLTTQYARQNSSTSSAGTKLIKRPALLPTPLMAEVEEEQPVARRSLSTETFSDGAGTCIQPVSVAEQLLARYSESSATSLLSNNVHSGGQSDVSEEEFFNRVSEVVDMRLEFHVREQNIPQSINRQRTAVRILEEFCHDIIRYKNKRLSKEETYDAVREYIDRRCCYDKSCLVFK